MTVNELLSDMKGKHEDHVEIRDFNLKRMMRGRSKYDIPDAQSLRQTYHKQMAVEADEMLTKLAKSEKKTAGQIKLTSKYEKEKKKITQDHQKDELTEYVNHFSNLAILMDDAKPSEGPSVALGFTKGLKDKFMQKKVQLDLKNAIQKSVLKRKEAKGESPDKDSPNRMFKKTELERLNERQVVFNKVLVEESKQMDNIKDTILR